MLIYIYLATLIFGGVLLGTSILLGGHGDVDADIDADLDLDLDLATGLVCILDMRRDTETTKAQRSLVIPLLKTAPLTINHRGSTLKWCSHFLANPIADRFRSIRDSSRRSKGDSDRTRDRDRDRDRDRR